MAATLVQSETPMTKSQRAEITFAVQPQEVDDGPVRFSGVAYSGQPVTIFGKKFVVDLSAVDETDVPVLTDHENEINAIAGRGRVFRADSEDGGQELRIEGQLSQATEAGKKIAALMGEGFPIRMSIGFRSEIEKLGGEATVNGRQVTADAVMKSPQLQEVSFVAVPADPAAGVREVIMCADLSDDEPTAPEEAAEPSEAEQELAAAKERITQLEAELASVRATYRLQMLNAALAALGRDEVEELGSWSEMTDAAFATALDALSQGVTQQHDPALFRAVGVERADGEGPRGPEERLMAVIDHLAGLKG
ncbi:MAG: hypothetical protein D6811_05090 [Alphaproteobacteria bacterium]|nr:MAG: hypothetical protein D6811_05090 [Alphaproteobacteria bacterium]